MYAAGAMAVYFGFRFLFYESDEDRSGRDAGEPIEEAKTRWNESTLKKKIDQGKRKSLLEKAKIFLGQAIKHCELGCDQFEVQSDRALGRGRDQVEQVKRNLHSARREMRGAWHRAHSEQRNYLQGLTARVEEIRNRIHTDVIGHIPRVDTDPNWDVMIKRVSDNLDKIRLDIAKIFQSIDDFEEKDARNVPAGGAGDGGGGPGEGEVPPKRKRKGKGEAE